MPRPTPRESSNTALFGGCRYAGGGGGAKRPTAGKVAPNLEEVKARGGQLFVFADTEAGFESEEGTLVSLPCSPWSAPIVYSVALQLLTYHVALAKGTDVDKPRNLAKSVTVE